jgi:uncharacterized protein with HEPN domain
MVRNFGIIGEAAKGVPPEVRGLDPSIPWRELTGLRDVVVHQYYRLEPGVMWEAVENLLPELRLRLAALRQALGHST